MPRRHWPVALATAASIAVVILCNAAIAVLVPSVSANGHGRQVVAAKLNEVVAQQALAEEASARNQQLQDQLAALAVEESTRNGEPAESDLALTRRDRQKLQVALASQGYDAGSVDGTFGSRSRETISAWQQKRGDIATGFLTAAQKAALLEENAAAIARWEAAQRAAYARYQEAQQRALEAEKERLHQQQASLPPPRTGWRWPWQ